MSEMIWYGKAPSGADVEVHIALADLRLEGTTGMIPALAQLDSVAKAHGFTRSERFDRPAGGFGGRPGAARPETPPPADLVVPEHCGATMLYKPPKEAADGKKAVAARWECRKGRDCAEAEERNGNRYPKTEWHMTKKPVEKPAPADDGMVAATGTGRSVAASPAQLSEFWKHARALNFTPDQVTKIEGTPPASLNADQLAALLAKLQRIADERVPA